MLSQMIATKAGNTGKAARVSGKTRQQALFPLLFTGVLSIFLSGCGGGSSATSSSQDVASDTELKSRFTEFKVSGLRFHTDSGNGLTDDEGYFTYQGGETIRFSLGNIVLGEFDSALISGADVSLAMLLGGTLPSDRAGLLKELQFKNETTEFDYAVNVLSLLYLLDQDGNIENGIQLSELDGQIDGSDLDLSIAMDQLNATPAYRRLAALYGGHLHSDYLDIIKLAYQNLEIEVAGQRIRKFRITEQDSNGASQQAVYDYDYDIHGLIETRTRKENDNSDIQSETSYTWDEQNFDCYTHTDFLDSNNNGTRCHEYDDDSQITEILRTSYQAFTDLREYNTFGQTTESRVTLVQDDTTLFDQSITQEFDQFARLSQIVYTDLNAAEQLPFVLPDNFPSINLNEYLRYQFFYDQQDRLIEIRAYENSDDESADMIQTLSYTDGLVSRIETDRQSDGFVDIIETRDYDENRNLSLLSRDTDAQFYPGFDYLESYDYDEIGNLVSQTTEQTHPLSGQQRTLVQTYVFENDNHMIEALERRFIDGELVYERTRTQSYVYQNLDDGLAEILKPRISQLPD